MWVASPILKMNELKEEYTSSVTRILHVVPRSLGGLGPCASLALPTTGIKSFDSVGY